MQGMLHTPKRFPWLAKKNQWLKTVKLKCCRKLYLLLSEKDLKGIFSSFSKEYAELDESLHCRPNRTESTVTYFRYGPMHLISLF